MCSVVVKFIRGGCWPEVLEAGVSLGRLQRVCEAVSPQSVFFAAFVMLPILAALAVFTAQGVVQFA